MLKLLNKFGLYTRRQVVKLNKEAYEMAKEDRKKFYQKLVNLAVTAGKFPVDCDLKIPKTKITIVIKDSGEVLAEKGVWNKLPDDGTICKIIYKHSL